MIQFPQHSQKSQTREHKTYLGCQLLCVELGDDYKVITWGGLWIDGTFLYPDYGSGYRNKLI